MQSETEPFFFLNQQDILRRSVLFLLHNSFVIIVLINGATCYCDRILLFCTVVTII